MTKGSYDPNKAQAIRWVAEKYKVERDYVRKAINGTSKGGITEDLLRDFRAKYNELKQIMS